MFEFVQEHWLILAIGFVGFLGMVAKLTETKTDDEIVSWLDKVLKALKGK